MMKQFEEHVAKNWHGNPEKPDFKGLAVMAAGAAGETGEYMEHFKKVIRDYDGDFANYPKRAAAMLEFGDALYYLVRIMQCFGFTMKMVMAANMQKLDAPRRNGK